MSDAKRFAVPLTICATAAVYDEHDPPADRAVLRNEHATALQAQHAIALGGSPRPPAGALVAAASNPTAKPHPELERAMRLCRLTAADIRKHGPREFVIVPGLRELVDASAAREKGGR